MKDLFNNEIPTRARGLLYLCRYNYSTYELIPVRAIYFSDSFAALNAYANIPNPPSQLATGITQEDFESNLEYLHKNMQNPEWQKTLANYL